MGTFICKDKSISTPLIFSSFQSFLLSSCFCFHLFDATCTKSLSLPRQTLGPCAGIRESGADTVGRLAALFSAVLQVFFGRHPLPPATWARSEGVAVCVDC